jgi:excisionase family DNA binding protein
VDQETYSTTEAAKILQYSNRRIQQMIEAGELEGFKDERGRWRVYQHSVHAILPERPSRAVPERPPEGSENASEMLERLLCPYGG